MQLHIKNGRVIDPANQQDSKLDLFIAEGRIVAHGKAPDGFPDGFRADKTLDATDKIVMPGLVDLSARLREPGQEHKGCISNETRAAAAGGITTLCVPPDTDPIIDTPAVAELIYQLAENAGNTRVVALGALTLQLAGEQLSEMHELKKEGECVGISNALSPIRNTLIMRRAMEYAASCDLTLFLHACDADLANNGCAHEAAISTRLGLPGIPEAAETAAVARELVLIEQTGVRAHFTHLSCARSVQMIARAQAEGLPVTADVAAHQLHLTDMDLGYFNSQCHVIPPLRSQRDRDALRAGLAEGSICAICSDHQPHDADAKLAPFAETEPGISALETLLPLSMRMCKENGMSESDVIARLTHQPASILGINAGSLEVGAQADICIYDPAQHWTVSTETLLSQGKNSPFINWELTGRVTHTLFNGKLVYELGGV